jgi:hypothetical protein
MSRDHKRISLSSLIVMTFLLVIFFGVSSNAEETDAYRQVMQDITILEDGLDQQCSSSFLRNVSNETSRILRMAQVNGRNVKDMTPISAYTGPCGGWVKDCDGRLVNCAPWPTHRPVCGACGTCQCERDFSCD